MSATLIQSEEVLNAAREHLLSYCVAMNQNYMIPRHIRRIANVLQRVDSGEIKRLIITIPPRHGKSMLVSQYFPAWWLGRNSGKYLIAASYGQDLADDFGRKVRNQFEEPLYQTLFDARLTSGSRAASRFATTSGGEYYAVGAGAAITGRGAHGLLIDDPIKSRDEAESFTMNRRLIDWYESTAYSRLMPGGWIAVICQRWNQSDLVGHLLKHHASEGWHVINMPAVNEDGLPLWPEQYDAVDLARIKQAVGPYNWASQYMQEPVARDEAILKIERITGYKELPKIELVVTAIDPAISQNTRACNTAMCTLGLAANGHVYDLETIADRWSYLETMEVLNGVESRRKPRIIGVESNQYQEALVESTRRDFPHIKVVSIKAIKDKFTRAKAVSSIIDQGRFHTNDQQLLSEISTFDPALKGEAKKDRVDALVHALHMIQKFGAHIIEEAQNNDRLEMSSMQINALEYRKRVLSASHDEDDDDESNDFDALRREASFNHAFI